MVAAMVDEQGVAAWVEAKAEEASAAERAADAQEVAQAEVKVVGVRVEDLVVAMVVVQEVARAVVDKAAAKAEVEKVVEGMVVEVREVAMAAARGAERAGTCTDRRSRYNRCQGCTALLCRETAQSANRARHPGTRHCWPGQGTCLRTTSAVAGLLAWVEAVSEVAVMAAT